MLYYTHKLLCKASREITLLHKSSMGAVLDMKICQVQYHCTVLLNEPEEALHPPI